VLFSIKSTGEWAMDKMIEMIAWNIKMSDMWSPFSETTLLLTQNIFR
jgi:hypothetical protein